MTTAETRNNNLRLANEQRDRRRMMVTELQSEWRDLSCSRARKRLAELLLDPPPIMAAMDVERVLLACKGMGPVKADRLLTSAGITTGKLRVRDIDPGRCELLSQAVAGDPVESELKTLRSQITVLRGELRRVREAMA